MQDKTFLQAVQELQDRIYNDFQISISHMLMNRTTATDATIDIKDKNERAVVTSALITGQIISLLTLMRDLRILDEVQYDEFTTYLHRSLTSQHGDFII
jgi:hypothetical protein